MTDLVTGCRTECSSDCVSPGLCMLTPPVDSLRFDSASIAALCGGCPGKCDRPGFHQLMLYLCTAPPNTFCLFVSTAFGILNLHESLQAIPKREGAPADRELAVRPRLQQITAARQRLKPEIGERSAPTRRSAAKTELGPRTKATNPSLRGPVSFVALSSRILTSRIYTIWIHAQVSGLPLLAFLP